MGDQTNPRKIGTTSGMVYVSLPTDLREEAGLEVGDRVTLSATENGFVAEKVEWTTTGGDGS